MMTPFLVTRSHGPAWREGRPLEEQEDWHAHADFINALEAEGLVVLGGPVEGTADALLVVWAEDEASARVLLDPDPWTTMGLLSTSAVHRWEVRIGAAPPLPEVALLRHTLATLCYRAAKAVRGAPAEFASFRAAADSRAAGQILAHVGDLLQWAVQLLQGRHVWREAEPLSWAEESERFFRCAAELDRVLASGPWPTPALERVFQGPIADALTHVGQINFLRRLAGGPVRGENYARAEIVAGRTAGEQAAPRVEFD